MHSITAKSAQRALSLVAKQEGKTVDEIRNEIMIAMNEAMKSENPIVQHRWAQVPHKGMTPTPEEVIAYVANHVGELR